MPKAKAKPRASTRTKSRPHRLTDRTLVVSVGCPSGIGPEVSVAAAARHADGPVILVGDRDTLIDAARLCQIAESRLLPYAHGSALRAGRLYIEAAGPPLAPRDRRPGRPSRSGGAAQLAYIDRAYDIARALPRAALVTGPVSKSAIAHSHHPGAAKFRGHTEWLQARDGARTSVMCFASERLVTSLVTTHLPLARVPRALSAARVAESTLALLDLLEALKQRSPRIAVCSLNPHAGEEGLLGREETSAVAPGIKSARRRARARARIDGPIGAETAFRKALAGEYDGVVAMYHDQATIPMKLVAFGDAVNVTMGLSIVRTSVDHGTGYDIAWQGKADASGMLSALRLGARLLG